MILDLLGRIPGPGSRPTAWCCASARPRQAGCASPGCVLPRFPSAVRPRRAYPGSSKQLPSRLRRGVPPGSVTNLPGGALERRAMISERSSSVMRGLRPAPGRSPSPSVPRASKRWMRFLTVWGGSPARRRSRRYAALASSGDDRSPEDPVCRGVTTAREPADLPFL